jgi:hypothetical protein
MKFPEKCFVSLLAKHRFLQLPEIGESIIKIHAYNCLYVLITMSQINAILFVYGYSVCCDYDAIFKITLSLQNVISINESQTFSQLFIN